MEERRGKTLFFIVESKRGVSSWVRLGPASVRLFLEGLDQCVKNGKEDEWEKGWKEKGRSYSMVRETNKVGCFLRLRVVHAEEKSYSICIPKGRGERGGWSVMADVVRDLIDRLDKKENTKEETTPRRLHVEMGKRWGNSDRLSVRVEIEGKEINRNMSRLGHCLVGRWSLRAPGEDGVANGEFLGAKRKAWFGMAGRRSGLFRI